MMVAAGLLLAVSLVNAQDANRPALQPADTPDIVGLLQWGAGGGVYALDWSPDGTTLATGVYFGGVTLWDVAFGERVSRMTTGEDSTVNSLAWSPDGKLLLAGLHEGAILVWDATSGDERASLDPAGQIVYGVAWSPDGTLLAAATFGGSIFVWDAADLSLPPREYPTHDWIASALTFSPDGTRIASGGYDNRVIIRELATGEVVYTLSTDAWVQSLLWTPDGTQLIAGTWDGLILVWNPDDGRLLHRLTGHAPGQPGDKLGVTDLALSPDGTMLASVAGDGSLRLWDRITGQPLVALGGQAEGYNNGLRSVAWSPDGSALATGADAGSVRLWGLAALRPGWEAQVYVELDDRLNVRSEPRLDTNIMVRLEDGDRVILLDGPVEAEGYVWWLVQTADGVTGWAVESADAVQTLRPVTLPTTYPPPAPDSGEAPPLPTPTAPGG
jgi:WD40 repeat protein